MTDLFLEERRVDDAHLHERIRTELVVKAGDGREHGFLLLIAHRVVTGVIEGDGRGKHPLLHLTDAVLIHLVVADVVHHVFRGVTLLSGIGHLIGQLLVPVL